MTNNQAKAATVIGLLALIIVLMGVGPFFTIWSLNTLFGLEIPMNFKTWAAVIWLTTVLHGIKISMKKND